MKSLLLVALLAGAVLAGGCAVSSDVASSGDKAEGTTLTGSRIKRPHGENVYGTKSSDLDKFDPTEMTRPRDPGLQR